MAPFRTSLREVVERFGTSATRLTLLNGLIQYRAALANIGLVEGFQWLDGSFTENVEAREARGPRDIDVITLYRRPAHLRTDRAGWQALVGANRELFLPPVVKLTYNCDAYMIDLDSSNPFSLVDQVRYWFGLFSHKRNGIWKGMVQIPLCPPGADAAVAALVVQRRVTI
jgi:hypothetical protein